MWSWLSSSVVQVVLGLAVLGVVIGLAVHGLKRLREQIDGDTTVPGEMLAKFRDLHQQGGLSDAEFRTIKTALGTKLQRGSDDPEKPGGEGSRTAGKGVERS